MSQKIVLVIAPKKKPSLLLPASALLAPYSFTLYDLYSWNNLLVWWLYCSIRNLAFYCSYSFNLYSNVLKFELIFEDIFLYWRKLFAWLEIVMKLGNNFMWSTVLSLGLGFDSLVLSWWRMYFFQCICIKSVKHFGVCWEGAGTGCLYSHWDWCFCMCIKCNVFHLFDEIHFHQRIFFSIFFQFFQIFFQFHLWWNSFSSAVALFNC